MTISDFLDGLYNNTVNGNIEWSVYEERDNDTNSVKNYTIRVDTEYNENMYTITLESYSNILYIRQNYIYKSEIKLNTEELISKKEDILNSAITNFNNYKVERAFDDIISSFNEYVNE